MNLCKVFFGLITFFIVILGILINTIESYLPVSISRTFRYGKFASKQESDLVKKVEVPKSYFRHIYILSAIIYTVVSHQLMSVYFFQKNVDDWFKTLLDIFYSHERQSTVSQVHVFVAFLLLGLQIFRRLYDTLFVSVFSKNAKMNLSHYFIGLAYYPALILVILGEAPKFSKAGYPTHYVTITDAAAVVLFFWSWYHQHVATVILANTRKNEKGAVVSQEYKIPEGDWFKYLSSPHSTAEILMYSALTVLLYKNTGWLYVYFWVLANQVETILLSHWWYQSNFKQFPKTRKALIPFIY